ncbi:MAG: hypothetical protein PV340_01630 [Wolbachia sp.]|nr:hypothetical protein [Wolbachia sp.]MDD9336309.1 hypothetical protein [Wolbachia sp.]
MFQGSDKSKAFNVGPEEDILLSLNYVNNYKLSTLVLELIENSKYALWTDNDGNMIFHHLAFLIERIDHEVKYTLIGVAGRILKLVLKELRSKLLKHENNDNQIAFVLVINRELYEYEKKLSKYKDGISKKEFDEIIG